MLVCATCGSLWDERAAPAMTFTREACPLCDGELHKLDTARRDDSEPVHADVARVLREHLLGVGA
jgi:hypothetical protein